MPRRAPDVVDWIEHDGIRFAYEAVGEGDPVVLLHGLGGDRQQSLGLVPEGPWRRVAFELRGHGDTQPVGPAGAYTFGTFADDVSTFLDFLEIHEPVVGGVSLGAGVALRFALDHPDRVRALLLIRPAWIHVPLTEGQAVWPEIVRLLLTEGRERGRESFRRSPTFQHVHAVSEYAAESLCSQFDDVLAVQRVDRLRGLPRSTPYDDPGDLSRVTVPALVVGSDRDPQHPFAFAATWAEGLPDAELVQVTSKAINPEAHNREVRAATERFLQALPGRNVRHSEEGSTIG